MEEYDILQDEKATDLEEARDWGEYWELRKNRGVERDDAMVEWAEKEERQEEILIKNQ